MKNQMKDPKKVENFAEHNLENTVPTLGLEGTDNFKMESAQDAAKVLKKNRLSLDRAIQIVEIRNGLMAVLNL